MKSLHRRMLYYQKASSKNEEILQRKENGRISSEKQKSKIAKKDLHSLIQESTKAGYKKKKYKHGKDLNIFSHLSVSDDENEKKKSKSDDSSVKNK